jgi:hypothetical protein
MHDLTMVLSGEVGAGSPPRSASADSGGVEGRSRAGPRSVETRPTKVEAAPAADAAPAFRWWTFAALIAYTASLLVFCGYVTLQSYSAADALQGPLAAAQPPHLSMLPFKLAHVGEDGRPLRMECYQVSD